MNNDSLYKLFDWDWQSFIGKDTPYTIRHSDGSAQVVFINDDQGRPIRVLDFLIESDLAKFLTDQQILIMGLEKQRQLDIWLTTKRIL